MYTKKNNLDLPPPDFVSEDETITGYTWSFLLTLFKDKEEEDKFSDWHKGQTCLWSPERMESVVYTEDVVRGLSLIRHKKPTYFD